MFNKFLSLQPAQVDKSRHQPKTRLGGISNTASDMILLFYVSIIVYCSGKLIDFVSTLILPAHLHCISKYMAIQIQAAARLVRKAVV